MSGKEIEQIAMLDRYKKRYLKGRCCGWCDWSLDKCGCGGIHGKCDEGVRIARRDDCLSQYKPRQRSVSE